MKVVVKREKLCQPGTIKVHGAVSGTAVTPAPMPLHIHTTQSTATILTAHRGSASMCFTGNLPICHAKLLWGI